jgi:hypothetical protein
MEMLAADMPEGQEPTHEQVMETYFKEADRKDD